MNDKKRILFVCTQNSARSQMAEGLMRSMYGDRYEVFSAGTESSRVNPFAIQAMDRAKIDISAYCSKSIDELFPWRKDPAPSKLQRPCCSHRQ